MTLFSILFVVSITYLGIHALWLAAVGHLPSVGGDPNWPVFMYVCGDILLKITQLDLNIFTSSVEVFCSCSYSVSKLFTYFLLLLEN